MAEQKAKAKGRKIGRNLKKGKTARYRDRFARCTDNKSKRILAKIAKGNVELKDLQNGTYSIVGYPGYVFVKHNTTLTRQHTR